MPVTPPSAPIKLPPEVAERLRQIAPDLERAKGDIEALKKLGLDTSVLEDKLRWAELARSVLLERFG